VWVYFRAGLLLWYSRLEATLTNKVTLFSEILVYLEKIKTTFNWFETVPIKKTCNKLAKMTTPAGFEPAPSEEEQIIDDSNLSP
jgi:hypothetical protein